jgi:hypothetical protein
MGLPTAVLGRALVRGRGQVEGQQPLLLPRRSHSFSTGVSFAAPKRGPFVVGAA